MFERVKRAWAIWMLANSSYGVMLDGAFSFNCNGKIRAYPGIRPG
jgi:hypothetical protein